MRAAACSWSSTRRSVDASTKPGDWRLRKRFCRRFNFELQAAATDNGLNIALAEQHSFPLADVFHFLQPETVQQVLEQAALRLAHLRHALALGCQPRARPAAFSERQEGSAADSAHARRRSAGIGFPRRCGLFREHRRAIFKIPDHPLVREVMKDVLTEAMDIDGLKAVLRGMAVRRRFVSLQWIRRCLRSSRTRF